MGPHSEYIGSSDVCEYCRDEERAMQQIRLKATVTDLHHGSRFTDGMPRISIHIDYADSPANTIRIPYTGDEYTLGDEFMLVVEDDALVVALGDPPAFPKFRNNRCNFEERLVALYTASDNNNRAKLWHTFRDVFLNIMVPETPGA